MPTSPSHTLSLSPTSLSLSLSLAIFPSPPVSPFLPHFLLSLYADVSPITPLDHWTLGGIIIVFHRNQYYSLCVHCKRKCDFPIYILFPHTRDAYHCDDIISKGKRPLAALVTLPAVQGKSTMDASPVCIGLLVFYVRN